MKGRLLGASAWMIVATTVVNLAMVAYHRLMSTGLGDAYADLYALSGVINVVGVLTLGLGAWMAKTLAVQAQSRGEASAAGLLLTWARSAWPWLAGLSLVCAAAAAPLAKALKLPSVTPAYWVLAGLVLSLVLLSLRSLLQGLQRFGALGASLAIEGVARPLFAWGLVALGLGLSGAVLGSVLALLIALLAGLPGLARLRPAKKGSAAGPALSTDWLHDAAALGLFSLLCFMDAFATKRAYDPERASHYARAALVAKSFLFLASALNMVLLPAVAAEKAKGSDGRQLFLRFLGLTLALDLAGLLLLWAFTPLALRLLVGSDPAFLALAPLVRVFAVAVIPLALLQLGLYYHLAMGSQRLTWALGLAVPAYALALSWAVAEERRIVACLGLVALLLLAVACWPLKLLRKRRA